MQVNSEGNILFVCLFVFFHDKNKGMHFHYNMRLSNNDSIFYFE